MTTTTQTAETGTTLFIPLNRLKKSPKNMRKTPHPQADIEALAASIAANFLLVSSMDPSGPDSSKRPNSESLNFGNTSFNSTSALNACAKRAPAWAAKVTP